MPSRRCRRNSWRCFSHLMSLLKSWEVCGIVQHFRCGQEEGRVAVWNVLDTHNFKWKRRHELMECLMNLMGSGTSFSWILNQATETSSSNPRSHNVAMICDGSTLRPKNILTKSAPVPVTCATAARTRGALVTTAVREERPRSFRPLESESDSYSVDVAHFGPCQRGALQCRGFGVGARDCRSTSRMERDSSAFEDRVVFRGMGGA